VNSGLRHFDKIPGVCSPAARRRPIAPTPLRGIPAPVLSSRFASRGNEEYAAKVLSAMRYEFGGHKEQAADKQEAPDGKFPV
jgi:6-phosphogluconate dehydrogenase (decarboxylating)